VSGSDRGWEFGVETGTGSGYPVRVGVGVMEELPGWLERRAPAHRYAILSDDRVFGLHGDRIREVVAQSGTPVTSHTFLAGEERKNRQEWGRLTDALLADGLARDGCVIALGGGVTGDLAGFVAATYMRGIPVVQLPTSLVAMVDSSVGGKTGVDVPAGKNLVGAFHPPAFVLADAELALTLPREERSQGLAEAVKHGAILDRDYFHWIEEGAEALLRGDPPTTAGMVARSVELKARVVSEDEREGGLRQILNFGHTLGHAIEAASGYRLPHGSSISIGMVLEARLGERLGVTRAGVAETLSRALRSIGLPVDLPPDSDPGRLLQLVSADKKVRSGTARYVFLRELGEADPGDGWSRSVEPAPVRELLEEARVGG